MLRTAAIPLQLLLFFSLAGTSTSMETPLYMFTRTQRSMDRENTRQMGDNKWGLKIEEGEDLSWLNHMALVRNNCTCLHFKGYDWFVTSLISRRGFSPCTNRKMQIQW